MSSLKLVCFSDTHKNRPWLPDGDVLIFAGDDDIRNYYELDDFLQYLEAHPHKHKLWIAGNHDFYCQKDPIDVFLKSGVAGIRYLENTGVTIDGVDFWGSPVTPKFGNWAFMKERGEDISKVWAMIPDKVDVLITHGPPLGILDKNTYDEACGCFDLATTLKKIQPTYHIFGHIHGWGNKVLKQEGVTFINASICDEAYDPVNPPVVVKYV